ncbi:SPOR domain-containing protein [Neptuniibacter marinus]|uniref:SPOR domain-containing protein n=1 Tax=Neptuniibacter marinus TaxID=1806670 RepID=UPI00082ECD29|nr:SPOR domain-containing protein [Neptuniibacter marinus]
MASRKDYAKNKRGAASASRSRPSTKKAPAKAKKRFPTGLLAITLILLGGLGYGLFKLTQIDRDPSTTPIANHSAPKPSVKKAPESKAPVVEKSTTAATTTENTNRFEFYEMLKESEVETVKVDAYKSTPKNAKSEHKYLLQAGSFKVKADAERMRAQLILQGLPDVHTDTSKNKDGTLWYRVRLGPFDNRSKLSKAYDKLVQLNIQPLRIKQ